MTTTTISFDDVRTSARRFAHSGQAFHRLADIIEHYADTSVAPDANDHWSSPALRDPKAALPEVDARRSVEAAKSLHAIGRALGIEEPTNLLDPDGPVELIKTRYEYALAVYLASAVHAHELISNAVDIVPEGFKVFTRALNSDAGVTPEETDIWLSVIALQEVSYQVFLDDGGLSIRRTVLARGDFGFLADHLSSLFEKRGLGNGPAGPQGRTDPTGGRGLTPRSIGL